MEAINFNKDSRFDFNLDKNKINGELMEMVFADFLTSTGITYEIKSESHFMWLKTGNIYIEYQQFIRGEWRNSGISSTEAKIWVHILKDDNGELMSAVMIPMNKLKERIKKLLKYKLAILSGKEKTNNGTATKGVLIPLRYLLHSDVEQNEYFEELERQKIERIKNIFQKK
jgi:hypothetical protein